jgi:hypothetical protein
MTQPESVVNLNNSQGLETIVWDATAVPDEIWAALQLVHRESIQSRLPQDKWDRAAALTKYDDRRAYRRTRVDPNSLVGQEFNDNQLFSKVLVSVVYDRSNQPVSGVVSANNTSASTLPPQFSQLECWSKMLTPPGLPIPRIGNKCYVHIRESYTHPYAQIPLDVAPDTSVVSALALNALYHSLAYRNKRQPAATNYPAHDLADAQHRELVAAIGMQKTGDSPRTSPGYDPNDRNVRAQLGVSQIMENIRGIPGIGPILDPDFVTRQTSRDQHTQARRVRNESMRLR